MEGELDVDSQVVLADGDEREVRQCVRVLRGQDEPVPGALEVDLCIVDFCFLKKVSGVRKLTMFYLTKNDHRLVTFISSKTITDTRPQKFEAKRACAAMQS